MEKLSKANLETKKTAKQLYSAEKSSYRKYIDFFIGTENVLEFVKYELVMMLTSSLPGAIGFLLRKWILPSLFRSVGKNVLWGRNISLRHPRNISIGNSVAIDDNCIFDAKGADQKGIQIGDEVVIARDTIIQVKSAWIKIGNSCNIGSQCQLSSVGGIEFGEYVGIAGQCYIGGGLYETKRTDIPMMEQESFSKGAVVIEDDVWVGAGVRILDGVKIGKGSFIGAGAVIAEDIDPYTIVAPYQKHLKLPRIAPEDELSQETKMNTSQIIDEEKIDRPVQDSKMINNSALEIDSHSDSEENILNVIYSAVDELNQQLPKEEALVKSPDTILFVNESEKNIDSIGLLNLIVATEQKVEEAYGVSINLSDDKLLSHSQHPFRSINSLAQFIDELIHSKV